MSNKLLYVLWGVLFIICAGLGFMPEPSRLTGLMALVFFLPPAAVLYRAKKSGDRASVKLVCCLSALSLGLTLVLLVANVLSAAAPEAVGSQLYYLLAVISAPMVCSGYWALSLFLWACLLVTGLQLLKTQKKSG